MVRDAVPLGECGRALVVKLRHHGDVLLASPVIALLKTRAPSLEVDALVYDDTRPMLEGHPALSQLFFVGRKWRERGALSRLSLERHLLKSLRARRYDLIVHLSEQPRGAWLARLLRPRYSVAPAMPGRGKFWAKSFTHLYPLVGGNRRHQVELNLDALRRIDQLVGTEPFVHLHPASRWTFKCWPAEQNAQLIDRLAVDGHRVVVTSAPDEVPFVQRIVDQANAKTQNLAGQLTIKELGALTARAKLFIGVDSMPMHLAAAMGTPTLALFGPSGEIEWGPWNVERRVVTTTHTCRPCGQDGCGGGKVSECLTFLPLDPVHAAARELLAAPRQ